MSTPMAVGASRPLTPAEERALSSGLLAALHRAGAQPRIVAGPHLGARMARLWRGHTPILAWFNRIFWPDALDDHALDPRRMSTLQHELQHVLEYATGDLSPLSYLIRPRNWRYSYAAGPGLSWRALGAEQRAEIVQDLWLVEHGLKPGDVSWYRSIIPWCRLNR